MSPFFCYGNGDMIRFRLHIPIRLFSKPLTTGEEPDKTLQGAELENISEHSSFFKNAIALEGSVTPKVIGKVLLVMLYALVISLVHLRFPNFIIPMGPLEYGGLGMGLILVFRVNAGYDRWWEGRKIWGNVVNHCRNLSMILMHYTLHDEHFLWQIKICRYIIAFPWLMKNHLRNETHIEEVKNILDNETYRALSESSNPILSLSNLIAKELNDARLHHGLDDFAFLRAEETRCLLVDALGGCERILKTPMPYAMAIKSHRFIAFFLLTLPLALITVSNIFITPIISGLVGYALLSLDRIAVELQNPFSEANLSHLPLSKICTTITQDIYAMLENT
jgi:putative membrane protein